MVSHSLLRRESSQPKTVSSVASIISSFESQARVGVVDFVRSKLGVVGRSVFATSQTPGKLASNSGAASQRLIVETAARRGEASFWEASIAES